MSSVTSNFASTATAGSKDTKAASTALNANFQDFLKLLTTQLQNQDPTSPADTNQLTQEIAMLSQVEQQINTNNNLQNLISLFGSTQINNAVGYIGKEIDAQGNQVQLSGGKSTLSYTLPDGAAEAAITVTNAAGQTVYTGPGTTIAGRNDVSWNGNSNTGVTMLDGVYNFTVSAKDASGNAVTATTLVTGKVTAVDTQNGTASLQIGKITVPLSSVQTIRATA